MAASIYATPPPDLNNEDTALSDVSNSSSSLHQRSSSNTNTTTNTNVTPTPTATTNNNNTSTADEAKASENNTSATTGIATATTSSAPLKQKRTIADALTDKEPKQEQHHLQTPDMGSSTTAIDATSALAAEASSIAATAASTASATQDAAVTMAAVAAAANAAMQLQLLEAINDAAKKRRKQNNPSRLGALNLSEGAVASNADDMQSVEADTTETADDTEEDSAMMNDERSTTHALNAPTIPIDYEEKLSKMFLPKSMEQLKETFELLQHQQQQQQHQQHNLGNISPTTAQEMNEHKDSNETTKTTTQIPKQEMITDEDDADAAAAEAAEAAAQQRMREPADDDELRNPYHTYCKECGENFETDFKLGLHMLQEHNGNNENADVNQSQYIHNKSEFTPFDILASVNVKLERPDYDSPTSPQSTARSGGGAGGHSDNPHMLANGKEPWMNAAMHGGMGFPFPPEAAAAAALSAGGYLPLLGVPGFPGVDGLNRPPLRIFNPEAYCDLCNKEFCNKYFLKTHKANKHGIYDPAISSGNSGDGGNVNTMSQMFQLQMQQQHQQIQQQHLQQQLQQKQQLEQQHQHQHQQTLAETQIKPPTQQQQQQQAAQAPISIPQQQITTPAPPPIFCDICSKRFTNVFAMRRHRAKAHEQQQPQAQRNSPNEQQQPSSQQASGEAATSSQDSKPDPTSNSNSSTTATEIATKQFQMPEGFRQDFTLEQEEVSFTPQPRKLSPQSQQQAREANFAHDKLKRLGVLNPESFCEICFKEYCNKYFLRTHKWKRHGIFVPPDDLKDEQIALAKKMPWPFINMPGMPLNLMMTNEKAVAAQRMLAAAAAASQNPPEGATPMAKRIKLEVNDDELPTANDENQENKTISTRDAGDQMQEQLQVSSLTSTPDPHKVLSESLNSGANLPASPEAAMGLQNLQKLQSMIQQLNDLNGKRPVACHICGRELENQYALHAHIMTEHAAGMDSANILPLNFQQHIFQQQQQQALKLSPRASPGSMPPLGSELRCNQCDRDFGSLQEFKQHIAEVHLLPGSPLRDGFVTPERPINPNSAGGTRAPYIITPTSSYCEICNKELCNKYFMKTHMQRMHGIEIENGAQIGGVVCNICNKELCSKYFLRVHKHNTHGIIEEGAPLPQPRQNGLSFETQQQQLKLESEHGRGLNMSPFGGSGGGISGSSESKSDSTDALYYVNYTEICPICARRFRSPKWLRAHLLSDHGPAGAEKIRELEQQQQSTAGTLSKPSSPTLKIPNGSSGSASTAANANANMIPNPANLAQALQNLNAQHLLGNMPKNVLPGMFGAISAEQALQSPRMQEYQCSLCPFSTPYYAFLFIHERSHSILNNVGDVTASNQQAANLQADNSQESLSNDETKLKNMTTNLLQDNKPQQLPLVQSNTTTDKNSIEPTNLSTRTPTPKTVHQTTSPRSSRTVTVKSPKNDEDTNSMIPVKLPLANQNAADSKSKIKMRSIATSPPNFSISNTLPQDILNEIANKSGKPACYAVPRDPPANSTGDQQMQAFIVEVAQQNGASNGGNDDSDEQESNCNRFVPAIIYLPVRERISGPITVSFNLTPA